MHPFDHNPPHSQSCFRLEVVKMTAQCRAVRPAHARLHGPAFHRFMLTPIRRSSIVILRSLLYAMNTGSQHTLRSPQPVSRSQHSSVRKCMYATVSSVSSPRRWVSRSLGMSSSTIVTSSLVLSPRLPPNVSRESADSGVVGSLGGGSGAFSAASCSILDRRRRGDSLKRWKTVFFDRFGTV